MKRLAWTSLGFALVVIAMVIAVPAVAADILSTSEIQVTSTSSFESDPTLGNDGFSSVAVYTSFDVSGGSQVFYQRFDHPTLVGSPVLVSNGGTIDQFNDVSGDLIAYSSFVSLSLGQIKVYEISTGLTTTVSGLTTVGEARIHGSNVVWVEGGIGVETIMLCEWNVNCQEIDPTLIAGDPTTPATAVEIGDTFIVWDSAGDIMAYDLGDGSYTTVAATAAVETAPATSGSWVVWEAENGATAVDILALNLDTLESRTIVNDGSANLNPTIDGDIVAWESNAAGNFDIYLYRLSAGDTFQVTSHPDDQFLNNVFDNQVAYVDNRTGTFDIFVTAFEFLAEADIDVSPPAVDFGFVELGTPAVETIIISNLGEAELTVNDISLQSGGSGDFVITSAPSTPANISGGGGSINVEVTFTPSAAEDASDVLEITSDDPDELLVQVPLSGRGVVVTPLDLVEGGASRFHRRCH